MLMCFPSDGNQKRYRCANLLDFKRLNVPLWYTVYRGCVFSEKHVRIYRLNTGVAIRRWLIFYYNSDVTSCGGGCVRARDNRRHLHN